MALGLYRCVLFSVAVISLLGGVECRCKMDKGEVGSKTCETAFQKTHKGKKFQDFAHPVRAACCVVHGMEDCVEYSYKAAKCSTAEQNIRLLISERVQQARATLHTAVKYVSGVLCKDETFDKCGRWLEQYNQAKHEIDVLNSGVNSLSGTLITCFLGIFLNWYL